MQKKIWGSPFRIVTSLVVFGLVACSRNNTDFQNVWGSDFTFPPLHEASHEERELGRAVISIRRAEGGTGAGFFISPDGLFITNEHVLPRGRCSDERCAGVQLIRNMSPGGDFEVFNQVVLLAANSDPNLDFAIGKVVGKNIHVPYLKLAIEKAKSADLAAAKLEMFGHPFGASTRVRAAKFLYNYGSSIQLRSPLLPGNSGGPVINMDTRTVVGLVSASLFHVETADRITGAFEHTTQAIDIGSIRQSLAAAFPEVETARDLSLAMFDKPRMSKPGMYGDLLPRTREAFLNDKEPTTAAYVGQFLGTTEEKLAFENIVHFISNLAGRSSAASRFARTSILLSLERGTELKGSIDIDRVLGLISGKTAEDHKDTRTALRLLSGASTPTACLAENGDVPTNSLGSLHKVLFSCLSTITPDQRSTLDVLAEFYKQHRASIDADVNAQAVILSLLDRQMLLEVPNQSQAAQIVDLLKHVENSRAKGIELEAEGTRALVEKDPRLISRGAFQNTF